MAVCLYSLLCSELIRTWQYLCTLCTCPVLLQLASSHSKEPPGMQSREKACSWCDVHYTQDIAFLICPVTLQYCSCGPVWLLALSGCGRLACLWIVHGPSATTAATSIAYCAVSRMCWSYPGCFQHPQRQSLQDLDRSNTAENSMQRQLHVKHWGRAGVGTGLHLLRPASLQFRAHAVAIITVSGTISC